MIIFISFLLLCVVVTLIASLTKAKPRQRKQTLTEREQFLMEWKLAQEKAKQETARINAVIREQERLAKEQERQAAQLEKHEEQLAKLEHRLAVAEGDIAHWQEQIGNLYALLDIEQAEQAGAVPGSKSDIQHQKKIITLSNQIHAAENRLAKAKFEKSFCENKLEVA